jgi:hypothetical protein
VFPQFLKRCDLSPVNKAGVFVLWHDIRNAWWWVKRQEDQSWLLMSRSDCASTVPSLFRTLYLGIAQHTAYLNHWSSTCSPPGCVTRPAPTFGNYGITPFILINWDHEPSGYAENPDNWIFLWK